MAAHDSTRTPPSKILVDRRALPALLARSVRLRRFQLTIETDAHGDTRAYLERLPAPAVST